MRGLWRTGLVAGGAFTGGGSRAPHGAGGFAPVLLPCCAAGFGRGDAGSAGLEGQPICRVDGRRAAVPGAGGAVCESGTAACGKDCGADGGQFRFSRLTLSVVVKMDYPQKWRRRRFPKGDRRHSSVFMPFGRLRRGEIPCHDKDQETWVCTAKGCRGRPQSPRLASAEAKSPACNNMLLFQTLRLVCTTILVIAMLPEGFPIALWTPSAVASHAD